jgi:hypothetical protein
VTAIRRNCTATTQTHRDGDRIIDYLLDNGGSTSLTKTQLAIHFGWHSQRITRAIIHVIEHVATGTDTPCCGFSLHYRKSGRTSVLSLLDPVDAQPYDVAVAASVAGVFTRINQHRIESNRIQTYLGVLLVQTTKHSDERGASALRHAIADLDTTGRISDATRLDIEAWLTQLATAP